MAITVTSRGTVCTNADSATYDIASVALTNGRVYIAFIYSSIAAGTAPSVSSVAVNSGTGTLTMVKQTTSGDSETFSGNVRRVECWRGICTASGTATMRATLDATSTNTSMQIYELDGVKTTGSSGADAVVQAACKTNAGTSTTSLTVSLSAFSDSNNRPLGFAVHRANEVTTHDSGGGYTELFDGAHNNPSGGVCVQWHSSSADTSVDFSWATSSANGGIALELAMVAGNVTVEVPVATLTLTTFAPKLDLGVVPSNASLTTSTFAPQVNLGITVPLAELTTTTFEPTVSVGGGGGPVEIVVPAAELVTTTFEPQVNLGVTVPAAELATTAFAPQVNLGVMVPTLELTTSTFAPVIGLTVVPPAGELLLTAFEPTVTATGGITVEVPAAALVLTSFAPVVTSSTPMPVLTNGPWLVDGVPGEIVLELGDEFYFVVTGPSADAPLLRITVPYS